MCLSHRYGPEVTTCMYCHSLLRQSGGGLYHDIDMNMTTNPEPWKCSGRYVTSPLGRHAPAGMPAAAGGTEKPVTDNMPETAMPCIHDAEAHPCEKCASEKQQARCILTVIAAAVNDGRRAVEAIRRDVTTLRGLRFSGGPEEMADLSAWAEAADRLLGIIGRNAELGCQRLDG